MARRHVSRLLVARRPLLAPAEHLGDLGIGEPFVVAENQHGALPPGQLPELG
jgi:hypothetical protein